MDRIQKLMQKLIDRARDNCLVYGIVTPLDNGYGVNMYVSRNGALTERKQACKTKEAVQAFVAQVEAENQPFVDDVIIWVDYGEE